MVEITEKEIEAIHSTHDKVIRMETMLGNGNAGLCHAVRDHQKRIRIIEITLAILLGGSGLVGSGFALAKLLGG